MKTFLIFFQGFLLGRTGSSIIGVTLLLSLVWWGGPYIGLKSQNARLWVMFGILVVIGAFWLGKLLFARYRSTQLRKVLQSGSDGPGREVEIAELREKMDSTIASLKTSGLGVGYRGNAALYALPWYLIIGPAAAGKTTLLRNSGLHFPYDIGENSDIKGFGGTRNCDWWFSDEAVLLDTAGRYTTEEDDKDEWTAFLGMLKKYRPKMPVNGVIVAVSLVDILTADKEGIDWHVKIIRDRLNELITHLGGIFPVYLTITKADLLHGFSTFFEDMGEDERDQVWGAWLVAEESGQTISQRFQDKLAELYGRLSKQRLYKLSMQRKFALKDQILDFPNQFKGATEKLQSFFDLLVKENPYQETPRFCGIYFTSGAQEGTPIQRIIGNLRQAFGFVEDVPDRSANKIALSGKGFFIKKFFEDVIFPNSDAVIRNKKSEVIQRWLKTGWIAASVALVIGSFILFSTSLTSNSLLAHNGAAAISKLEKAVKAKEQSMGDAYEALDEAYSHYAKLMRYEEDLPWHLLFGIYQGDEQIKPMEKILLASMEMVFFQSTQKHIEYRLTDYARQWETFDEQGRAKLRERYYSELKSYLMASELEHLDADYAVPVLASVWKGLILRTSPNIVFTPEDNDRLNNMVRFYLSRIADKPDDSGLLVAQWQERVDIVERSRQNLRTPPNAERLYTQIINKANVSLKPKTLDDLLKGAGRGIITSSYQLPGAFTGKEWRDFIYPEINSVVEAASRGDWALGSYAKLETAAQDESQLLEGKDNNDQQDEGQEHGVSFDNNLADQLKADIRKQYFKEYVDAWFTLIQEVNVVPSASLDDAVKKTLSAARSDGPIGELMRVVARNINIYEPESEESGKQIKPYVEELDIVFADLRKFATAADRMNTSILVNQYLLVLSTIQGELERLSAAVDVNRQASIFAAKILGGSGGDLELYKGWVSTSSMLNGIEPRTRKVTENLLISPIRNAWGAVLQEAAMDIQRQWKSKILVAFSQNLSDKFPFDRNGKDASLAEVADFFNPRDGIYWNFVNEYLSPYLDKGRYGTWRVKTWLANGPEFTPSALSSISRATTISNGLFRKGTDEPDFLFYVYPIPLLGLSETALTVNGQEYRYRNEPQEWRKFNWPGNNGDAIGAKVLGIKNGNNNGAEMNYSGFWGIFRLIENASLKKESSREYLYTWKINGPKGEATKVQFMLKADRDGNILEKNVLTGFSLPATLFKLPNRIGG